LLASTQKSDISEIYTEFNFITVSGLRSYRVCSDRYYTSQLAGELLDMDVMKGTVLMLRE
jgi:hypothetical protein